MVTFRETPANSEAAVAQLTAYFESRELGFTGGVYKVVLPRAEDFEPPDGVFLVVEDEDLADEPADVGCGGIRDLGAGRFEVKHLWLDPSTRGRGYGRLLLEELERRARDFGATELVLDTNASLEAAAGLYRSSGFVSVPPYNDNPNATNWYAKPLT
jgi:GNAT superfamily N-acetyltransferase